MLRASNFPAEELGVAAGCPQGAEAEGGVVEDVVGFQYVVADVVEVDYQRVVVDGVEVDYRHVVREAGAVFLREDVEDVVGLQLVDGV